jgi:hypothetical protein
MFEILLIGKEIFHEYLIRFCKYQLCIFLTFVHKDQYSNTHSGILSIILSQTIFPQSSTTI